MAARGENPMSVDRPCVGTKRPLRMTTAITGQSGARVKPGVRVGVMGCPPTRRHKRPKRKPKRRAGKR